MEDGFWKKIRLGWIGLLFFIIIIFIFRALAPSGKVFYGHNFLSYNYVLGELAPAERIIKEKSGVKIIGEPAYFSLRTLRPFNQAGFKIKYQNKSDQPIVEAGVLADKKLKNYQLVPLENKILDQLSSSWRLIRSGKTILLQREERFGSIEDFLKNPPLADKIALYNYDLDSDFIIPDYEKSGQESLVASSLRGAWRASLYLKEEPLKFTLAYRDLNENKDSDEIDLNIYARGALIVNYHWEDDGAENGQESGIFKKEISLENLPVGVYDLEFKANDDIVVSEIKTKLKLFSFKDRLWLDKGAPEKIALFSNAKMFKAVTSEPSALGSIKIGQSALELKNTYEQVEIEAAPGVKKIEMPKGGIIISDNGFFSFQEKSFFSPGFKKVDAYFDPDEEGVDYILADYNPSVDLGNGWKEAEAVFDLKNAYREREPALVKWLDFSLGSISRSLTTGRYGFVISVPGLRAEDGGGDYLEICAVGLDLSGTSFFEKIKKILW